MGKTEGSTRWHKFTISSLSLVFLVLHAAPAPSCCGHRRAESSCWVIVPLIQVPLRCTFLFALPFYLFGQTSMKDIKFYCGTTV
ncbi:MAG: hypothetical protein J3R72DRAFT_447466 [Linnemannia gamsii]|nr:MAG: hypothetical protein J3R72DRAFT_447466 [Linnemannia gamsii]